MKRQDDNDNNCKKIQTRVSESVKITCDPQPGQFNCKTQANQRSQAIPPDAHFKSIQFWRGGSVFLAFKNEKKERKRAIFCFGEQENRFQNPNQTISQQSFDGKPNSRGREYLLKWWTPFSLPFSLLFSAASLKTRHQRQRLLMSIQETHSSSGFSFI